MKYAMITKRPQQIDDADANAYMGQACGRSYLIFTKQVRLLVFIWGHVSVHLMKVSLSFHRRLQRDKVVHCIVQPLALGMYTSENSCEADPSGDGEPK